MKNFKAILLLLLCSMFLQVNAQTEIPKGFKKGIITLYDNSIVSGYIKDNIRRNASIILVSETGGKKKNYDGADLISAEMDSIKFLCINGDFFTIISYGDLNFLQKASDASGKPSYYGNTTVFTSGTEGKPGDYFMYNNKDKKLELVSKKNFDDVVAKTFAGSTAAIDKAKTANGDVAQLKEAVDIYNRNKK